MRSTERPSIAPVVRALAAVALASALASTAGAQPVRVSARFQPPTSWADLVEAVSPAVVSIQVVVLEEATAGGSDAVDPFEFFFGEGPETPRPDASRKTERRADVGGSGFLISRDGLVVTNLHVVDGAFSVKVHMAGRDYPATVRGTDRSTDIALLQVDADGDLPYLELADSDALRVGDWLMVIGNPLNLDQTVTTGVVSAKGRSIGISDSSFENFIQTDAAINFGNSGGPVLDVHGRVVGIATAVNYGAENIGFAVPINTLRGMLPQLREKGRVTRGSVGLSVVTLTAAQAPAFGVASGGAVIVPVDPAGTPAAAAGVRRGDVITAVDGRRCHTTRDMIGYVASLAPGAVVTLDILRDGQPIRKEVTLGARPAAASSTRPSEAAAAPARSDPDEAWWGVEAAEITGTARNRYGIPAELRGALVKSIAPVSRLYDERVRPGAVVTEINGKPVLSAADLDAARDAAAPGSWLRLYVHPANPRKRDLQPFFAVTRVP